MIKQIFILIIFSSMLLYSQVNPASFSELDSLRIKQKISLILQNKLPLYTLGQIVDPFESLTTSQFNNNFNPSILELNSFAMNRVRNNINQSMLIYREGLNKNNLGVVTDVLGYVSTAAAFGLAAYHVYKFRKHYGLK